MDVLRVLGHLYFLILHYNVVLHQNIETKFDELSVPQKHILQMSILLFLCLFFLLSGVRSARWLTKNIQSGCSYYQMSLKFYLEHLAMIVPIVYLYYFTFAFIIVFLLRQAIITEMLKHSWLSNFLFIFNYFSIENNVNIR